MQYIWHRMFELHNNFQDLVSTKHNKVDDFNKIKKNFFIKIHTSTLRELELSITCMHLTQIILCDANIIIITIIKRKFKWTSGECSSENDTNFQEESSSAVYSAW